MCLNGTLLSRIPPLLSSCVCHCQFHWKTYAFTYYTQCVGIIIRSWRISIWTHEIIRCFFGAAGDRKYFAARDCYVICFVRVYLIFYTCIIIPMCVSLSAIRCSLCTIWFYLYIWNFEQLIPHIIIASTLVVFCAPFYLRSGTILALLRANLLEPQPVYFNFNIFTLFTISLTSQLRIPILVSLPSKCFIPALNSQVSYPFIMNVLYIYYMYYRIQFVKEHAIRQSCLFSFFYLNHGDIMGFASRPIACSQICTCVQIHI